MTLKRWEATGFRRSTEIGRTKPLILDCLLLEDETLTCEMVVKTLGPSEVYGSWQLVSEVMGNAAARRLGVHTPLPCVVHVSEEVAVLVKKSLAMVGASREVLPGPAAGCEFLRDLAPYTTGQSLTPEQRIQAARIYVCDLASENLDRTGNPVNCGLTREGLTAFDFEACFSSLFVPVLLGELAPPWKPSKRMKTTKCHLFHKAVKSDPPTEPWICDLVGQLDQAWMDEVIGSLPNEWHEAGKKIAGYLSAVRENRVEFAKDVLWSLST